MKICDRQIGEGQPTFIIAELSANHNGDLDCAKRTIEAMAKAGADAVKLQTYTADTLTIDSDKEYFQINKGTVWDGLNLYKLYQEAYTPWEWHKELFDLAHSLGLICFSSPFDPTAVDLLEELEVPVYKIASFEITDIPLIEYIASKGKPVILSTGISELKDIERAMKAFDRCSNKNIALLKCTSSYPAPFEEMNLKTIPDLAQRFGVISGLSDHSMGHEVAVAAVAMGARIVEKHFILDRNLGGPDSGFSMEPAEFEDMVRCIRNVEKALGTVQYELSEKSRQSRGFSRSLFIVEDVKAGDEISDKNVRSIRPGDGLAPRFLPKIVGRKFSSDFERGTPLSLKHFESSDLLES